MPCCRFWNCRLCWLLMVDQPRICVMWLGLVTTTHITNVCMYVCMFVFEFEVNFIYVYSLVYSDKWRRNNNDEYITIYKLFLYQKTRFCLHHSMALCPFVTYSFIWRFLYAGICKPSAFCLYACTNVNICARAIWIRISNNNKSSGYHLAFVLRSGTQNMKQPWNNRISDRCCNSGNANKCSRKNMIENASIYLKQEKNG